MTGKHFRASEILP
jgi:uncharacterized membrane protein